MEVGDIDRKSGVPYQIIPMRQGITNRMRKMKGSTIPRSGPTTSCRHQVRAMKNPRFVSVFPLSDQPLQAHARRIPPFRGLGQKVHHGFHQGNALREELLASLLE